MLKFLLLNPFLQLFLGMLIMSSSGVLGRIITLPAPIIIWFRCGVACLSMFIFYLIISKKIIFPKARDYGRFFISGLFFGLHWITFFYALQYSSVAIGMLSLFTFPIITVLLEPLFFKLAFNLKHFFISLVAFLGIYLLIPEFSLANDHYLGVLFGVSSATFYAIRNILLKKIIKIYSGDILMFYQMLIILVVFFPVLWVFPFEFHAVVLNWQGLLILGVFTSAIGHSLFVHSFKHFPISTVSIISNLVPLFGSIIAFFILNEKPNGNILLSGALIFLATLVEIFTFKKDFPSKKEL